MPYIIPPAITTRKPLSCERMKVNWEHPLNKNLVAGWLINEGSGGIVRSVVPNRNAEDTMGTGQAWVADIGGPGVSFSGDATYVQMAANIGVLVPSTVVSSFRLTNMAASNQIVATDGRTNRYAGVGFNVSNAGKLGSTWGDDVGSGSTNRQTILGNGASVTVNKPCIAICVWDAYNAARLYADGMSVPGTLSGTGTTPAPGTYAGTIGYRKLTPVICIGVIYWIMIYSRALSIGECFQVMSNPFGTPDNPRLI